MKNDIIFEDAADVIGAVNFSALDGANIFVTGATGLLGTHFLASLCLLREAGYCFNVVGHHQSTPAAFTEDIVRRGGFRLTHELPLGSSDIVIHAAGYAQPLRFTDSPAETIRLNTEVTSLLLRSLTPRGRLLFTSSSEVYSGNPKQVVTEYDIGTTTPYHPRPATSKESAAAKQSVMPTEAKVCTPFPQDWGLPMDPEQKNTTGASSTRSLSRLLPKRE